MYYLKSITFFDSREQPRVLRNPFKLYQRLETHGAKDFEYFTFENNYYLVVANEYTYLTSVDAVTGAPLRVKQFNVDSVIYWWTGKMFVEWQRIPTEGKTEAVVRRSSVKKGVLKNFLKSSEKHLCQSLFFHKVADRSLQLNKCFSVNLRNLG